MQTLISCPDTAAAKAASPTTSHSRRIRFTESASMQLAASFLVLLSACSSPPELAQVKCCRQQPVNTPEWIAKKSAEHQERMRKRQEIKDRLISEAAQMPTEEQITQEMDAADEFIAQEKAKKAAAAEEAGPQAAPAEEEEAAKPSKTIKSPRIDKPLVQQGSGGE
jgi:hypothetical protein